MIRARDSLFGYLAGFALGLVGSFVSFTLGLVGGGPLIRQAWGVPRGFGEDYTTWQGIAQAVLAQALFLVPVLALCGRFWGNLLQRRPSWFASLVMINPVSVLCGYWLCYQLLYTGRNLHVELLYFRISVAALWALMSLVFLAPAVHLMLRFGHRGAHPNVLQR